jgi:hypothetical protein
MNSQAMQVMHTQPNINPLYYWGTLNPAIIKETGFGNRKFPYVPAPEIVALLDKTFYGTWSFEITDQRADDLEFDILFTVFGRMTIPGMGIRDQSSSSSFISKCTKSDGKVKARDALRECGGKWKDLPPGHVNYENTMDLWKTAATDCMKKGASWFGIARYVYGLTDKPLLKHATFSATPAQLAKLTQLKEKCGGEDILLAFLHKYNPMIERLKDLESSVIDPFIDYVEQELSSIGQEG